jgi:hypothetical protein
MIDLLGKYDWSDLALGKTLSPLKSSYENETLDIEWNPGVRPFPEPPFIFPIGEGDTREFVFCIGKESDTRYTVSRDPLGTGMLPLSHRVGEKVSMCTSSGAIFTCLRQILQITQLEGHIAFLEDLLHCSFGKDTFLIQDMWEEYDHFKVEKDSKDTLRILPGACFIKKDGSSFSRMLVVPPEKVIQGITRLRVNFPTNGKRQGVLVYIGLDGKISVRYGTIPIREDIEPPIPSKEEIEDLFLPLASLVLNGTSGEIQADNIKDLRYWRTS